MDNSYRYLYLDENIISFKNGILINICESIDDDEIIRVYFGDSNNRKYCYLSLIKEKYLFGDVMDKDTEINVRSTLIDNIDIINNYTKNKIHHIPTKWN